MFHAGAEKKRNFPTSLTNTEITKSTEHAFTRENRFLIIHTTINLEQFACYLVGRNECERIAKKPNKENDHSNNH